MLWQYFALGTPGAKVTTLSSRLYDRIHRPGIPTFTHPSDAESHHHQSFGTFSPFSVSDPEHQWTHIRAQMSRRDESEFPETQGRVLMNRRHGISRPVEPKYNKKRQLANARNAFSRNQAFSPFQCPVDDLPLVATRCGMPASTP